MLILSRKLQEAIVINGNISIQILEINGNKVRLGIIAPKEISVHREEVQKAIEAQNEEAKLQGLL